MSALNTALGYAARGWPVFPCTSRKIPMIKDWGTAATKDPATIRDWWGSQVPHALTGIPTGERTGIAVLDIDMKHGLNGCRTLAGLGYADLPATPTVLTPSGGFHLHFERPERGFANTVGAAGRGIGEGLDWRCDGGYVVLPSPGSGYAWGEWNYDNAIPLPVPEHLRPREREANPFTPRLASIGPTVRGLTGVLQCLGAATPGERNNLLFWAACRFAEGVAARLIGEGDARDILSRVAGSTGLTHREIAKTINSAFGRGA
jgi:hypothetical protein